MRRNEFDNGWEYLVHNAESRDRDTRYVSLLRSYAWVEHALKASGLVRGENGRSTAQVLRYAQQNGLLSTRINIDDIHYAINVRHLATHVDTVPEAEICKRAVKILESAWCSLRRSQVGFPLAARIADLIHNIRSVRAVYVYGSLSRGEKDPNDMDFLVLDDGTFSNQVTYEESNYTDRKENSSKIIDLLDFSNEAFLDGLVQCRWIDINLFDGDRFGVDEEYTKSVISRQSDSNFFLNISVDLKVFNRRTKKFHPTEHSYFSRLRDLKMELAELWLE